MAEVLITLVVIGIIAAVTVPVIMENHKKIETSTRLKKFASNLLNAIRLTEIDVGVPSNEWGGDVDNWELTYQNLQQVFNKISATQLMKNGQGVSRENEDGPMICENIYWTQTYTLSDGTLLGFEGPPDPKGHISWNFLVDVNGEKAPNSCGRDIFAFNFNVHDPNKPTGFIESDLTREQLIENCKQNQGKVPSGSNQWCSSLLLKDGWEFKDDYPVRL